jgi:hypothetical protein
MAAYTVSVRHLAAATSILKYDNQLSLSFPAVARKKITAIFDGGRISSDGSVMLLLLGKST